MEGKKALEPPPFPVSGKNGRDQILSQFIDLSSNSESIFKIISLKKIKKQASNIAEKEAIEFTLNKVGWNRSRAAAALKISYKTLLYKIKEFNTIQHKIICLLVIEKLISIKLRETPMKKFSQIVT